MNQSFTESVVEQAALDWLAWLGWQIAFGPEMVESERGGDFGLVLLEGCLRQALARLNPKMPASALEEAFRKITRPDSPSLVAGNHARHRLLVEGVPVEYQRSDTSLGADRRVGVVWHTQGSGKSLAMAFYAERVILEPAMKSPAIVVITDRNDLDEHLFRTFACCKELLRQEPVQAENRDHLRALLKTDSGGVIFTTVHRFFPTADEEKFPLLSERRNIVVMADEANRSQCDFVDGFAAHMRKALPRASFIGFTGTPIEKADANTRTVFGDYTSVYDIKRAVKDGATVPIYYASRLAKLKLDEAKKLKLDEEFEEATEGEEEASKHRLKIKWAAVEALVGAEKRIKLVEADLVAHWEKRLETMDGKAMIVCMSRRICMDLYSAIVAIRPDWHHPDDDKGALKFIRTSSAADPADWPRLDVVEIDAEATEVLIWEVMQ